MSASTATAVLHPPEDAAEQQRSSAARETAIPSIPDRGRRLSDKLGKLCQSLTLDLKQTVHARRRRNLPVYDFGLGETKGFLSPIIKDGAFQAVSREDTFYTHPAGLPEARRAVLKWLSLTGVYSEENVVISGGAKQCLLNTFMALCDQGDVVLLASCPWVSYAPLAHCVGALPQVVRPEQPTLSLKTTAVDLERAIRANPRSRLFLLNNPCNPTGQLYSAAEQSALLEVCVRNKIFFVLDRLYWRIVYNGAFPEPVLNDRTLPWLIQIDGLSKNFRRTGGLRAGWSVAPADISAAMTNLQSHHSSGASTLTQKVVTAALNADYDDEMVRDLDSKRKAVEKLAGKIPLIRALPTQGAFYSFWDVRSAVGKKTPDGKVLASGDDVARYLLDSHGIVTAPGSGFMEAGFLRLSFHIPMHEIRGGLEAAARAFAALV